MKLRPHEVAAQLKSLGPNVRFVLIYGPDTGLVEERAKRLIKQVIGDSNDPFLLSDIAIETVKNDPTIVYDEACQPPLTGEKRVIRIDRADDTTLSGLNDLLEGTQPHNLVVLTASNLSTSSKLRKLAEEAKDALAIACYSDTSETIDALIDQILTAGDLRIAADARQFLLHNLGSDRGVSRSEIEKLALYKKGQGQVTLQDVELLIGDTGALTLERVAEAALDGDTNRCDEEYQRALESGIAPIALIRIVLMRLEKLHRAALQVKQGRSPAEAIGQLRPPVFWKDKAGFERQLRRWNPALLERALDLMLNAEVECKTSHIPAEEACSRALLRLAAAGARNN
ncbi:MAG: DNA polymerase III subunit delta [Sphingomonadales bacterium]